MEDASPDNRPTDHSDVPFLEVRAHHHEALDSAPLPLDLAQVYAPNESGVLMSMAAEDTLLMSPLKTIQGPAIHEGLYARNILSVFSSEWKEYNSVVLEIPEAAYICTRALTPPNTKLASLKTMSVCVYLDATRQLANFYSSTVISTSPCSYSYTLSYTQFS